MLRFSPAVACLALAPELLAQSFVNDTTRIPIAPPFNGNDTEQIDFGDVDGDGDLDVVLANGGDLGNQQNRVWINALGSFSDETATRFPVLLDTSRDLDFADIDGDGDLDLHSSAESNISNQGSHWWINMGGAQGGAPGFYQDQTAARWLGIGGPGSSVPASQVLAGGGFIEWGRDVDFGDFDNDGWPDLFESSAGIAGNGLTPSRIFLNDGSGAFREFNPSGYVPAGNFGNGSLGIWCQGTQQANTIDTTGTFCDVAENIVDSDLADQNGDFDLDIVMCGEGGPSRPRAYHARRDPSGALLAFRDMTGFALASYTPSSGKYEQELGDLDDDGDLDLYGVNWGSNFDDLALTNNGLGVFSSAATPAGSSFDEEEADFIDYDADGDLDVYVANFSGTDRLHANTTTGGTLSFADVSSLLPSSVNGIGRDADCADVDGDGDTDVFSARSQDDSAFVRNVTQIPDTHAPRVPALEQAPDQGSTPTPTVVRAHVLDNQPDYITGFASVQLEWSTGGAFSSAPMTWSGGQVFRGVIPALIGTSVTYRVRATDARGNVGVSAARQFHASNAPSAYCTAGTTTNACSAVISSTGVPSVAANSGFVLRVDSVEGQRSGLVFSGVSGRLALPWWSGSSSYLCVRLPVQRAPAANSGGSAGACDGALALDWRAYMASNAGALGNPLVVGQIVDAQAWFRDPPSPKGSSLSNALEFVTLP